MFGKHVKHFHFANYIAPSKLEAMLKHCKNVIHLSLPLLYNFDRLKKIVHCMGNLQVLDVLSTGTHQQHFTLASNLKELRLRMKCFRLQQCLEEWVNFNYIPKKLNILCSDMFYNMTSSLYAWISMLMTKPLQRISSTGTSAWCSIYFTEYSASIPHVQLQVADSSVIMSSVKASKYGILGLYGDTLHLTQGSYRGEKVQKALLIKADVDCVDTSIISLTSITYFDASCFHDRLFAGLFPGHLEQLSIACPNLQRLNLSYNSDCLNNLQGLHSLAVNCKSLRGLSLKAIHSHEGKCSRIELWEILCSLRFTQLAIEPCTIKQCDSSHRNAIPSSVASFEQQGSAIVEHQRLDHLFQRYTSLQLLEVGDIEEYYLPCTLSDGELLLLTKFPSITSYRLCNLPSNNCNRALKQIFDQKYLRCLFLCKRSLGTLSLSMEGQCPGLQHLYINSASTVPTEAFIETLCSHGGLEHVILFFKSLTLRNIENIIERSSNLVTFHVYLNTRAFLKAQLKQLTAAIKAKFSKRRLFNGGSFTVKVSHHGGLNVNNDTDLMSVWDYY